MIVDKDAKKEVPDMVSLFGGFGLPGASSKAGCESAGHDPDHGPLRVGTCS